MPTHLLLGHIAHQRYRHSPYRARTLYEPTQNHRVNIGRRSADHRSHDENQQSNQHRVFASEAIRDVAENHLKRDLRYRINADENADEKLGRALKLERIDADNREDDEESEKPAADDKR